MKQLTALSVRPVWQLLLILLAVEVPVAIALGRRWLPVHQSTDVLWSPYVLAGAVSVIALTVLAAVAAHAVGRRPQISSFAAAVLAAPTASDPIDLRWHVAVAAAVVIGFGIVEAREPYYFLQDDNWAQFFPAMFHGARSFFGGTFPTWNPHIFNGVPSTELGIYALTYPVTYLSYALAQYGLGNEMLMLEIFALLHLVAGALVTQTLARRIGMRNAFAAIVALSFTLCGYSFSSGRSWYYVLPLLVWLPAMLLGLLALQKRAPSLRVLIGLGLSIGIFFHAGNAQLWAYAVGMLWLAAFGMAAMGTLPMRRLLDLGLATLLGLAVAAPLLLPQTQAVVVDRGGLGCGMNPMNLISAVLPFPLSGPVSHPCYWGGVGQQQMFWTMTYSGTLGALAAGFGLALMLLFRLRRDVLAANLWLIIAVLIGWAAVGHFGKLWTLLVQLPVFSRFAHPFKLIPFFVLAMALGGGLILQRLTSGMQADWRRRVELALAGFVFAAMLYATASVAPAFYRYNADDTPYASLPPEMARILGADRAAPTGRILGVYASRADDPDYSLAMPHNVAAIYGLLSFNGYTDGGFENGLPPVNQTVMQARRPDVWKELGVRWVVILNSVADDPVSIRYEHLEGARAWALARGTLRYRRNGLSLYEIGEAAPLAFFEGGRRAGVNLAVDGAGASVDLPPGHRGGAFLVNVLALPAMRAYVDGVAVPAAADPWGRVRLTVPQGARRVSVRYEPQWLPGIWLALVCALLAFAGYFLLRRLESSWQKDRNGRLVRPATEDDGHRTSG